MKRGGFTLIEVLISAALGAILLTAAVACLSATMSSQKIVGPRTDVLQSARVALAMMAADLRAACPLDSRYALLGAERMIGDMPADNIDFATHHYTPRHEREGDYCEVSYYVDKDGANQFGLWRRRNPTLALDPLSGGSREEIAPGLRGLKLEYTDGIDWYDSWGTLNPDKTAASLKEHPNLEGMPQAVRITLSVAAATNEPPLVFRTVAFLELANASLSETNITPIQSLPGTTNNGPTNAPSF